MRARNLPGAIIIALLLCCLSCGGPRLPAGVSNDFFWMPEKQRNARFEKYDFDAQYAIYIYGCQKIEPPEIDLAWQLARQGAPIVQPLEAKLEIANDDLTIRDIFLVFRMMSDLRAYDVAADQPLMAELRLKASDIRDPAWAIIAQDDLAEIRANSPKAAPSYSNGCVGCGYKLVGLNDLVNAGVKYDGEQVVSPDDLAFFRVAGPSAPEQPMNGRFSNGPFARWNPVKFRGTRAI